jgi:sterol desaturase/sphingolipid hydroxylase (fatty acid hydroxylase superfamily)
MNLINTDLNFWFYWLIFCGIILSGYFVMAFSVYYLLYSVLGQKLKALRTQAHPQDRTAIKNDIKLSVLSCALFAFGAACFMVCYRQGYTQVYTRWSILDLGYISLSYITVLILQDTYFYFAHRLSHQRFFYPWTHQGHHQSRPPTPWTFFALEPLEALGQAAFLFCITFIMPLHIGVLIAILLTMSTWAMGNHLGVQIVPNSFISRNLGQWFIGSAHHLVHHKKITHHYGLYFTFWDKFLGTQDPDYEEKRLSGAF